MQPSGLIFDCDGTLVDSMPLHWRAWDIVCKRHGIEFSEKRHYAMGGMPSRKILALLKEEQGLDFDPAEVSRQKEEAYIPLMPEAKLIEPIASIARAAQGNVPMAVATGGRTKYIRPLLEGVGILDWFGAVVKKNNAVVKEKVRWLKKSRRRLKRMIQQFKKCREVLKSNVLEAFYWFYLFFIGGGVGF